MINANKGKGFTLIDSSRMTGRIKVKGFTLIELLVVISIISFISSVIMASVIKARVRARDSQRIQNARQIAIALEQYEHTFNTYKVANAGLSNNGSGFVAKSGSGGYTNSILSALKTGGLYTNTNLTDPIYGTDNYYLGLCTSTNSYNIFVKLEQPGYSQATSSIVNSCGGAEAVSLGFSFIASTAGGASGGGGTSASGGSGFGGFYETGMSAPDTPVTGLDGFTYGTVTAEDGRIWLDRNLGAARVATAFNDAQAYGHYYQYGRGIDGHQIPTSALTSATSSTPTPGHGNFITVITGFGDWLDPPIDTLWQGLNGVNNPCPAGFRVPTQVEWQALAAAIPNFTSATCGTTSSCLNTAYNSKLKLVAAGNRNRGDGSIFTGTGSNVYIWASTNFGPWKKDFNVRPNLVYDSDNNSRAFGFPVRCIKD